MTIRELMDGGTFAKARGVEVLKSNGFVMVSPVFGSGDQAELWASDKEQVTLFHIGDAWYLR